MNDWDYRVIKKQDENETYLTILKYTMMKRIALLDGLKELN